MPTASEYDHPASSNVQRVYNQGRIDPFDNAEYSPPLKAFNDVTAISAHYHTRLLKTIEEQSSRLYNFAAWAVGMPRNVEFEVQESAVIVMNAGSGMGLSLSLAMAEEGYTVLGLVHEDLDASEAGSLGRSVYIWNQRKASILARRKQHLEYDPYREFPNLGEFIQFPFNPLSEASRKRIRQSVLAYCHLQKLHLRSLVLAPVFAIPLTRGGLLGDHQGIRTFPPSPTLRPLRIDDEPSEWEKVVEPNERRRTVVADRLASHPPLKHAFYAHDLVSAASREGSYLPIHLAHQDVIQRAFDRDFKEQALVAGLFSDILGNPPNFEALPDPYEGPDGEFMYHWDTKEIRYSSKELLPKPDSYMPPPVPGLRNPPTKPTVSRLADPDARAGIRPFMSRWTHWTPSRRMNLLEAFWEATKWRFNLLPSQKITTATIIWLTGCSEGSFSGSQGFNRAIDSAREEMGLIDDVELNVTGVRVSVVKTAPLRQRVTRLANFWPNHPEWDPRTRADADTPDISVQRYRRHFSRANLLSRISALWAIEDDAVHWIVKRAIHAPYHKRTYSFGLDVMIRVFMKVIPDSLWQLFFWVVYENLGLKTWEMWMMDKDYKVPEPAWPLLWIWMFVPSLLIDTVYSILGWWADKLREPDYGWRMD